VDGSEHIALDAEPTSLVDEGLRIARQYGLGADFESELEGLKKATTAGAAVITVEESEESVASNTEQNHGAGEADHDAGMADVDQDQMET